MGDCILCICYHCVSSVGNTVMYAFAFMCECMLVLCFPITTTGI